MAQVRDVTRLAVFETSNLVVRVDADGVAQRQDRAKRPSSSAISIDRRRCSWRSCRRGPASSGPIRRRRTTSTTTSSPSCERCAWLPRPWPPDAVFLRRAYLDVLGVLPTPDETRRFLADARPDKRARLIDALLERPEFADFWALKWADLLHCEEKALDAQGRAGVPRLDSPQHRRGQAAQRVRPRTDRRPRQHLQPARRQLVSRPARSAGPRRGRRPGLSRHPHAVRPLPQSPLRPLDADRLSQPRRLLQPRAVSHRRKQPPRQSRQARVRRRADRVDGSRAARSSTRDSGEVLRPLFLGATRRLSPRTPTACSPWPTGSPIRTIRFSPALRPTASGITCSAAASSSRTTISAPRIRPSTPRCWTPWPKTSPPTASICAIWCARS